MYWSAVFRQKKKTSIYLSQRMQRKYKPIPMHRIIFFWSHQNIQIYHGIPVYSNSCSIKHNVQVYTNLSDLHFVTVADHKSPIIIAISIYRV